MTAARRSSNQPGGCWPSPVTQTCTPRAIRSVCCSMRWESGHLLHVIFEDAAFVGQSIFCMSFRKMQHFINGVQMMASHASCTRP